MPALRALAFAFVGVVCCGRAAPAHAKAGGTHFLAELDLGACLSGDAGPAASIALGAGGKFKGFAPRFYLLGTFARSEYTATLPSDLSPWPGSESGSFGDLALGPRVYVPIIGPLRWFGEGLIGASYASGTYLESGLAPLEAAAWVPLAIVSTGLQWRLLQALALGVRVGFAFNQAGLIGVERVGGLHDTARTTLTAGVTWHF